MDAGTTTVTPSETGATTDAAATVSPEFARASVVVGDAVWKVAVADTAELRSRGLMGVTDLDDVDGMLFVFDEDTTTAFFMLDTLIPLDIAFFAADGSLVSRTSMVPCDVAPCLRYRADGPYRYALETRTGGFDDDGDLTLTVDGIGGEPHPVG